MIIIICHIKIIETIDTDVFVFVNNLTGDIAFTSSLQEESNNVVGCSTDLPCIEYSNLAKRSR